MPDASEPVALVTGGTGGLGAAVTAELRERGWRVVVPWVDPGELERIGARPPARAGESATSSDPGLSLVRADVFEPADARVCVQAAGPRLRGVVNLVGGFAAGQRVAETPVERFEEQLRLNLRPTYLVCNAALPVLAAAGGGAIVCVGSRAAQRPFAGAAGYCASKAAVAVLARVIAEEGRPHGIRCNAVLPSVIDTPANRRAMGPDAPMVPPEQIARVIAFLLSEESAPTSGAEVPVFGDA
jgi:NAD(P)-dependent dehydrogenase (short-subunit alcohol dehydrogenase family)